MTFADGGETTAGREHAAREGSYVVGDGQIIEALAGERYEDACVKRILAKAGVKNPRLDADWGGIMQAASGWTLSGPEYLAFIR